MLENSIQESKNLLINLASQSKYRIAQENGQRIFGPPLDWPEDVFLPEKGTEVFIGKIPRDCFENELIPLFQMPGKIYKMRLMIDFSGKNRGYGFVQYFSRDNAKRAVSLLNNYPIRRNWCIGVMPSRNNNRLFFGNLPNNISRNEMINEISKYTSGIKGAIYYGGSHRTNGFGFVEYDNHKLTALARRKFFPGSILIFGRQPKVDWAKSEEDCEEDDLSINKSVLYVRFFKMTTTEDEIQQFFSLPHPATGYPTWTVQRVKKIRNFAFIHYQNFHEAQEAFDYFQSMDLSKSNLHEVGQELEIKWAKNRPSSPLSTSPSLKSPEKETNFISHPILNNSTLNNSTLNNLTLKNSILNNSIPSYSEFISSSRELPSNQSAYHLFGCNESRFESFGNFNPFVFSGTKVIST